MVQPNTKREIKTYGTQDRREANRIRQMEEAFTRTGYQTMPTDLPETVRFDMLGRKFYGPTPEEGGIDSGSWREGAMPKLQATLTPEQQAESNAFEAQRKNEIRALQSQITVLQQRLSAEKDIQNRVAVLGQLNDILQQIEAIKNRPAMYSDRPFLSPSERMQAARPAISSYDTAR